MGRVGRVVRAVLDLRCVHRRQVHRRRRVVRRVLSVLARRRLPVELRTGIVPVVWESIRAPVEPVHRDHQARPAYRRRRRVRRDRPYRRDRPDRDGKYSIDPTIAWLAAPRPQRPVPERRVWRRRLWRYGWPRISNWQRRLSTRRVANVNCGARS